MGSTMLAPNDLAQLSRVAQSGHPLSIVLRRAGVAQAAQTVQLVTGQGGGRRVDQGMSQAAHAGPRLHGAYDMNVQQGDRFTAQGAVYEVIFVHPYRDVETICDCEAIQ